MDATENRYYLITDIDTDRLRRSMQYLVRAEDFEASSDYETDATLYRSALFFPNDGRMFQVVGTRVIVDWSNQIIDT